MPTAKKKPATNARPAPPPAARAVAARRPTPPVPAPKPRWSEQYEQAVKEYAHAVELVQKRDWSQARPLLGELVRKYATEPDLLDISDRARAYLKIAERRLGGGESESADPYLLGVYY